MLCGTVVASKIWTELISGWRDQNSPLYLSLLLTICEVSASTWLPSAWLAQWLPQAQPWGKLLWTSMKHVTKLTFVVLKSGVTYCCPETQRILTNPEKKKNFKGLCDLRNYRGEKKSFLGFKLRYTWDLLRLSKNYGYIHSTSQLDITMAATEGVPLVAGSVLMILYALFHSHSQMI